MFEARLDQGVLFKKALEAVKDLVDQSNFHCTQEGLSLQALDRSHVAMVSMLLRADGFEHYRCDRSMRLGMKTSSLSKIFKCSDNRDSVTIKAEDDGDTVSFMFESSENDRMSDFEVKLMTIDADQMGVPDADFAVTVKLPSVEFQRICRDLSTFGETIAIRVEKDGITFSANGDLGTGSITLKSTDAVDKAEEDRVVIEMDEPVNISLAASYLTMFTKATALSGVVTLKIASGVPVLVDYNFGDNVGYVQYYLAPKVDDDDEDDNDVKDTSEMAD